MHGPVHVYKLGGSLLDLPDLGQRLEAVLPTPDRVRSILLVGGGRAADLVRQFDALFEIGEEAGHWLAVRAMQLNSHLILAWLPRARLVAGHSDCHRAWRAGSQAVVDPLAWLKTEHDRGLTIRHHWSLTSDSIAAHIARGFPPGHLTLLKSMLSPHAVDRTTAVSCGLVDADFASAAADLAVINLINLRADPPTRCVLQCAGSEH